MKSWSSAAALGLFILGCSVACGDDGAREDGDDSGPGAGASGEPGGGVPGTTGGLSAGGKSSRGGAAASGTGGAQAAGGDSTGGTDGDGGAFVAGGQRAESGAPSMGARGGFTQGEGGSLGSEPAGGASGGDAATTPSGASGEGGAASGGARSSSGGSTPSSGGSTPSSGGSTPSSGGTATRGGTGGSDTTSNVAGAESGSGGSGGDGEAGSGGAAPTSACGDGILSPGEFCCTPEWVEQRVENAVELWEASAVGRTGCVPATQDGLIRACGSAACDGGAVGCRTEITRASFDYLTETGEVDGSMDIVIAGQASLFLSCNFVATMNDFRFRSDVVTDVTAEALRIGIAEPRTAFTVAVSGCSSASGAIAEAVRTNAEEWIRDQLVEELTVTEACPY